MECLEIGYSMFVGGMVWKGALIVECKPFCNGGGCLNIKIIMVGVLGNRV